MKISLAAFLFLLCNLCFGSLAGQLSVVNSPESLLPITERGYFVSPYQQLPELATLLLGAPILIQPKGQQSNPFSTYQPHLAFFCRVEVKIDKAVGTPFRFRLGSVDYVDYLEGKRRSY